MKLNLLWNSNDLLNGYINVDPFGYEQPGKYCENLNNLSCFDGSIDELRAVNVLSYYDFEESGQVLKHWLNKIKIGGKLVFGELHVDLVVDNYVRGNLDSVQFTKLMYNGKKNVISMDDILQNIPGFKVTKKNIMGYYYIVEAVRAY